MQLLDLKQNQQLSRDILYQFWLEYNVYVYSNYTEL